MEDAPQRKHFLQEVFDGLRSVVRTGVQRRFLPNNLPPLVDDRPAEPARKQVSQICTEITV